MRKERCLPYAEWLLLWATAAAVCGRKIAVPSRSVDRSAWDRCPVLTPAIYSFVQCKLADSLPTTLSHKQCCFCSLAPGEVILLSMSSAWLSNEVWYRKPPWASFSCLSGATTELTAGVHSLRFFGAVSCNCFSGPRSTLIGPLPHLLVLLAAHQSRSPE